MNETVKAMLTRARTQLILDHPFFGQLALRLRLVEDEQVPTLAVDGKNIIYNPGFIQQLSANLLKSALAHEVMHCVYDHMSRRGDRNPMKWNMAGDYAINLVLRDSGFEIGKGWLLNPAFADMTADHIYSLLPDNNGKSGPEAGDASSEGFGGNGQPLDDVRSGDPAENEITSADWKVATIQAANAAKVMGKLPASLQRFVEELVTPKVDWREYLRRFITEVNRDDYSWMRPNRRFLSAGLYMPSLYSESMGEIVVVIDTSGSIDNATLAAFATEIKAITAAVRPSKTHVIYCDASVAHVDTFTPNEEMTFGAYGGGGTDFRPPFRYIEKHGIQPQCLVYLTDMYGAFPDESAAPFPVLWCATTDQVGPFGDTVQIEV